MSETTDLFLIAGATGKTGVPTVELLRQSGFRVRALVHTPDERATKLHELGAEVVQGDLLDFDAVSSAMAGVAAYQPRRGHRRHAPDDGRAVHHLHPDFV